MPTDAFKTLHDIDFKQNAFLHHYTNLNKAYKILNSDCFRFSNLESLNDTTEYKPKVNFKKDDPINQKIFERCIEMSKLIKIGCFTQDKPSVSPIKRTHPLYFTDYTGRGFAFPRMWAQYGNNGKGVCFVINKEKLEKLLKRKKFTILQCDSVKYVERHSNFELDTKIITYFKECVFSFGTSTLSTKSFMQEYPQYCKKNFFTKYQDWRDECEYRIALVSNHEDNVFLKDFSSCLEGIVVGENTEPEDVEIIGKLSKKDLPIKKICFETGKIILQ